MYCLTIILPLSHNSANENSKEKVQARLIPSEDQERVPCVSSDSQCPYLTIWMFGASPQITSVILVSVGPLEIIPLVISALIKVVSEGNLPPHSLWGHKKISHLGTGRPSLTRRILLSLWIDTSQLPEIWGSSFKKSQEFCYITEINQNNWQSLPFLVF